MPSAVESRRNVGSTRSPMLTPSASTSVSSIGRRPPPSKSTTANTTGGDGDLYATSSYPDFLDLQSQNQVFSDMLGYSPSIAAVKLTDRSRLAMGEVA